MHTFYRTPTTCQIPNLSGKWEALFGQRRTGCFVEVGAYDGESFSNTSCLADVGWAGVYVEPVPEFAEKCRQRHAGNPAIRVVESAVSDVTGEADLYIGDTLTSLSEAQVADYSQIEWAKDLHKGRSQKVRTTRLDVVLEDANIRPGFDLLAVDVEGLEKQVFYGFDIAKWRPKVILVELEDEHPDFRHNERVVSAALEIRQRAANAGYEVYYRDIINTIFIDATLYSSMPLEVQTITPRVTVGIPTHNGSSTIARTLRSLASQTYKDFKVVISENASTDATASYIQNAATAFLDIRVIRQSEVIPPHSNFLAVLEACDTEYFIWLADDDFWDCCYLEECVRTLDRNLEAVTAFSDFRVYYHFADRYSPLMTYVESSAHDRRLNMLIRSSNMAPCAIYGLHRSFALRAALKHVPGAFDFSDVAITIAMAGIGQMLVIRKDLFRAGVKSLDRLQRKSLDGKRIRYKPFSRFLIGIARRTFGWKSAIVIIPELLFQLYRVKRHNDAAHRALIEPFDSSSLLEPADVEQAPTVTNLPAPQSPDLLSRLREAADASGIDIATAQSFNSAARDTWVADRAAKVNPGLRVLDVGAGTAPYKDLFSHCVYETHDFTQYSGYKGAEGTYAPIDYVSDITSIPVADASYDVILCTEVLEHVPHPIEAIAEMTRIVKPGGRLFISAPLGSGLHQEPYHFYGGYTDHWYRKYLHEFGCDVEEILPNHGWFAHLAQECARFSWTYDMHKHLHDGMGPEFSDLMGNVMARYFYSLDKKALIREFTVGFHVTARKRLP